MKIWLVGRANLIFLPNHFNILTCLKTDQDPFFRGWIRVFCEVGNQELQHRLENLLMSIYFWKNYLPVSDRILNIFQGPSAFTNFDLFKPI